MIVERLGESVSEALDAYVAVLDGLFGGGLVGVYLYGSMVYDAYDPEVSDVDVVVLHRSDLIDEQRRALVELHEGVGCRYADAARLDVSFVPLRLVGTYGEDSLPYYREGRFQRGGGGDVNMVMWHTLNERGVALRGPPAAEVVPPVGREELDENMRRNAAYLSRRMQAYVAMGSGYQVFGVLSLCRVVYTLNTGEVTGKTPAGRWALRHLGPEWRPPIQRAVARYESKDFAHNDPLLRERAEDFAAYVRSLAG